MNIKIVLGLAALSSISTPAFAQFNQKLQSNNPENQEEKKPPTLDFSFLYDPRYDVIKQNGVELQDRIQDRIRVGFTYTSGQWKFVGARI